MAICTSFLSLYRSQKVDKQVLYISYDGMTDPLGQSQVIPYLIGLSRAGYKITLLSCEKREKYEAQGNYIHELLKEHNIHWEFIFFTSSPPILAKYYDLHNLKNRAIQLYRRAPFSLVHCRSYVSAAVGFMLKQKFGIKFLFDIRGFWVDERVDGGLWDLKNPFYKRAYQIYKKKEARYVSNADTIVSLTENGKQEMEKWPSYKGCSIDVIPCCADYDLFTLQSDQERDESKAQLGFAKDDFVISYLGSIGTWYMLEEMLDFFKQLKSVTPKAKFLFVSNGEEQVILNAAEARGIAASDIKIVTGKRKEVPGLIKASSLSLSFIKPCYSKKSSSPTKLGELLAMGIPVINNTAIGDVDEIILYTGGGLMLMDFLPKEYKRVIDQLDNYLSNYKAAEIRQRSQKYYDLKDGVEKYKNIYDRLLK